MDLTKIPDYIDMHIGPWRERLQAAIKEQDHTRRQLSDAMGQLVGSRFDLEAAIKERDAARKDAQCLSGELYNTRMSWAADKEKLEETRSALSVSLATTKHLNGELDATIRSLGEHKRKIAFLEESRNDAIATGTKLQREKEELGHQLSQVRREWATEVEKLNALRRVDLEYYNAALKERDEAVTLNQELNNKLTDAQVKVAEHERRVYQANMRLIDERDKAVLASKDMAEKLAAADTLNGKLLRETAEERQLRQSYGF